MEILLAENAGFCWGVKRAVQIARQQAKDKDIVYTDGPLIHNRQMMEKLASEGIREVGNYQSSSALDLKGDKSRATLVVRAHGISPLRRAYLKSLPLPLKDATCPDVGIIAAKIKVHINKGFSIVIFGDSEHPEVIGLMGYTQKGKACVVRSEKDIATLPQNLGEKICMVSQSTMFTHEFHHLGKCLQQRFPQATLIDTICKATKDRQGDIDRLKNKGAQAIVVIGGRHSANTKKLVALTEKSGLIAYHIESLDELPLAHLKQRYHTLGLTAGASTPDFLIQQALSLLQAP